MDARLVAQALNYHGQQLQKVWEGERNENELAMLNLKEPNFEIYQQRQKTLRYLYIWLRSRAARSFFQFETRINFWMLLFRIVLAIEGKG